MSEECVRSAGVGVGKRPANGTRKPAADVEVRVPELQVSGPGDGDNRVKTEEEQTE